MRVAEIPCAAGWIGFGTDRVGDAQTPTQPAPIDRAVSIAPLRRNRGPGKPRSPPGQRSWAHACPPVSSHRRLEVLPHEHPSPVLRPIARLGTFADVLLAPDRSLT
jgi:hypothetical protein